MSWTLNVLIAVDQLGNAITGGNPDNTISARAGFFSRFSDSKFKHFWTIVEKIIDKTFEPVDGKNHCLKSYHNEKGHSFDEGNDVARGIMALGVIIVCLILIIPLHIAGKIISLR
jgi:hypothetical protein